MTGGEATPRPEPPPGVEPHPVVGPDTLGDAINREQLSEPSVVAHLDQWRQGDLVSGARVYWAVEGGCRDMLCDVETYPDADGGWALARVPVEVEGGGQADQLGVIVSQSCDIAAVGPGSRHLTVQVAPLVNLENIAPERVVHVRAGNVPDMVMMTGDGLPGGEWAADLRISLPVSKAVLLSQEPTRGFADESEALAFGGLVALKYRRPALHDYVSKELTDSLNKLIRTQRGKKATWMDRVEQIRVLVTAGDRLNPQAIEPIVVTLGAPFEPKEQGPLRTWRNEQAGPLAEAVRGCVLEAPAFRPLDDVRAIEYRNSVPLALDELPRRPFWF